MKSVKLIIIAFLIIILFAGCANKNKKRNEVIANSFENSKKDENYIEVFGIVKSIKEKSINLTFAAQIDTIPVKEGQKIKEGDVLLTLSLSDLEIQIRKKEYELLNEEFELKKTSLENYGPNSKKYLIQQKKVDNLQFELNQLKETLIKNNIINGQLLSDVKNGVVSDIGYAEGDFIQDDKKIMTLYDLDSLKVVADIPEEFIKDVKIGNKVKIIPVADRSREYDGTIERIYNVATEVGGETIIYSEISIDNQDNFLLPNFNVDVRIISKGNR